MQAHSSLRRALQTGLCGVALLTGTADLRAENTRHETRPKDGMCVAAFKTAQARQRTGDLVAAKELYGKCSAERCGSELWQACLAQEAQLYSEVPSVVLLVSDHQGEPLVDVEVTMDGQLLTARLNGLAYPVNPGTHELAFAAATETFAPQRITVAVGDRNHLVSVAGRSKEATAPQLHAEAGLAR